MYKFNELSSKVQNKVIKDYQNGWLETHPNESLTKYEVSDILMDNLKEENYDKKGNFLED